MKKGFSLRLLMIMMAAALMLMLATAVSFAESPIRDTDVYYPQSGNMLGLS